MELCELSVGEIAGCIRRGEVSAEDYARALLAQCEAGAALGAFVARDGERLLASAREADRARGEQQPLGRLYGVPLAVKDAFDVAGMPTTAATPALRDNVPRRTARVLERLFAEGALLLGKTNMDELAFGLTGDNRHTGPVRNPYDPARTAGGSSGGSAAAVAARMAPAAVGTDTSGSIRIPAAHCALVGYRPSTGRYPSGGMVPMNHTRDTAGLLARSVDDIALLDAILSGEDPPPPAPLRGARIGVPRDALFAEVDPRIAEAAEAELSRLAGLGAELVEAEAPDFAAARAGASGAIMAWELPRDLEAYLREVGQDIGLDDIVAAIATPLSRAALEDVARAAGAEDLESRYRRAIAEVLPAHREEYRNYFETSGLSAMAFPTTTLGPPVAGHSDTVIANGEEVSVWRTLRNTMVASLLGAPSITLPIAITDDGMPIGLALDGLPGGDRELLSLALAWQRKTGPVRPPPAAAAGGAASGA